MSEFAALDIFLHDQPIALLTHLPGDRNLLSFNKEYIFDPHRPTLSLSFKDPFGELITEVKSTRTRLPPFLANLLPEGHMRDYLASQAKIDPQREFYLLAALGEDLPGALRVAPSKNLYMANEEKNSYMNEILSHQAKEAVFRFSLAGLQLKFSAIMESDGGLTIPVEGNALIGNGDMHLKNWSLIYPDKVNAKLAPAYDFVSTIPYLPEDQLALTFVDSKAFGSLTYEQLNRFAAKAQLSKALVQETARETVHAFREVWQSVGDFQLDQEMIRAINKHLDAIPLYKG